MAWLPRFPSVLVSQLFTPESREFTQESVEGACYPRQQKFSTASEPYPVDFLIRNRLCAVCEPGAAHQLVKAQFSPTSNPIPHILVFGSADGNVVSRQDPLGCTQPPSSPRTPPYEQHEVPGLPDCARPGILPGEPGGALQGVLLRDGGHYAVPPVRPVRVPPRQGVLPQR